MTWRVVAFVLALLALIAVVAVAVGWYARHTYYVGVDQGQVAIFKGRPGGLLWFKPTLEQRKNLRVEDVLPVHQADLKAGKEEATFADAQRYVNSLQQEAAAARAQPAQPATGVPAPTTPVPTSAP
jgi:protein phosphatase